MTALIGVGGMGEVYRATDTRLKRDVAVKVLPAALAGDADRLARFQREAEVLASLNHPNIGGIHGVEEGRGVTALVLELVEGPTLADRIAQGAIPIDEALSIVKQIAEALEAAHEQSIIHRDLKPSNIKVRADGTVKVLDFGLAKALDIVPSGLDPAQSPTITSPAITRMGVILGTAAYMSPEQARGRPVDKRTDIWAFGCVLYEMLAGRQAFAGDSVSDHLAAILERDPDWSALPPTTSAAVGRLLRRCLDKDTRRRLRDIGDGKLELEAAPEPAAASRQPRSKIAVAAVASLAATLLLAAAVAAFLVNRSNRAPAAITRLVIPLSSDDAFGGGNRLVAISPDGRRVVYVANQRLYMRSLDQLEATVIAGTEPVARASVVGGRAPGPGAANPFFSSDGQWVGFTQGGLLKKVAVGGGPPLAIDPGAGGFSVGGSDWLPDGFILLGRRSVEGRSGGIWMVPAAGGSARQVVQLDVGKWPMTPQMLPGGTHILFTLSEGENWDEADIVVQSLKDGGRQILVHGGVAGRYVNSGHLVYGHSGSLHAIRFDPSTRRTFGPAVPAVSGIAQPTSAGAWGGLEYAVSDTGTLVYVPAAAVAIRRVLVWVDRSGREEQVPAEPRAYQYPRLSPDGARVLVESRDEQNDLWSWDLVRGTLTRVTFNRRSGGPGVWTRNGTHVLFGPDRGGIINIFQQHFSGTGSEEGLLTSPNTQYANVVSPDGRWLVYEETDPTTKFDLRLLALDGSHASTPLLHMPFNEQNPDISPDGRWLAYQSDESGRAEVYVRPFPDVAKDRWPISTGGGTRPLWSRDGRELLYLDADRQLTAAPVETRSSFRVTSAARKLFDTKPFGTEGINRNFDVSPDGKRFLFTKNLPTPPDAKRIIVVGNWLEELKQRVPAK